MAVLVLKFYKNISNVYMLYTVYTFKLYTTNKPDIYTCISAIFLECICELEHSDVPRTSLSEGLGRMAGGERVPLCWMKYFSSANRDLGLGIGRMGVCPCNIKPRLADVGSLRDRPRGLTVRTPSAPDSCKSPPVFDPSGDLFPNWELRKLALSVKGGDGDPELGLNDLVDDKVVDVEPKFDSSRLDEFSLLVILLFKQGGFMHRAMKFSLDAKFCHFILCADSELLELHARLARAWEVWWGKRQLLPVQQSSETVVVLSESINEVKLKVPRLLEWSWVTQQHPQRRTRTASRIFGFRMKIRKMMKP